jgi:S1-C subfamily serine protease
MLYSKYKRTVSGNAPLTLPNTTTSSTNFSGNAYGSGGSATYSGTANTTNYGTKTTYIPYSYDQSDFLAIYWIKSKPRIFGINYEDLTEDIRRKTGSNKGVLVTVVTKDSPAFDADILRGDVIKNIGDVLITNIDLANKTIDKYQGQEVDVLIFRDDKEIHKKVKLRKEPN